MLKVWKENDIQILVQSTLYVGAKLQGLNPSVELLNKKISEYCTQQGIAFLDVNSVLSPDQLLSNEYSCDDLHLNAKAYQTWAELLKPMLDKCLHE